MQKRGRSGVEQPKTPRAQVLSIVTSMLSPRSLAGKRGLPPDEKREPPPRATRPAQHVVKCATTNVDHYTKTIRMTVFVHAPEITPTIVDTVMDLFSAHKNKELEQHNNYTLSVFLHIRGVRKFRMGINLLQRLECVWKITFNDCPGVDAHELGPVPLDLSVGTVVFKNCSGLIGQCVHWAGSQLKAKQLYFVDCADFEMWPRLCADSAVPTYFKRFCFMSSIEHFVIRGKTSVAGEKLIPVLLTWRKLKTVDFRGCTSGSSDYSATATICNLDCEQLLAVHAGVTTCGLPHASAHGASAMGRQTIGHRVHFLEHTS